MKMGAASQGTVSSGSSAPAAQAGADVSAKQQACLKAAATQAAEQKEKEKATKGFGRLMGSLTRTAQRFGLSDIGEITKGIYDADATADDVAVIAEELGISEDEVRRCRQP